MDKKPLNQEVTDKPNKNIQKHEFDERNLLMDGLMANELSKDKKMFHLLILGKSLS